ncbi:ribonuclease P protein component [Francisella sp. Scap27]|uniref:ribonuclease P protein component n=1 Tax=Francisella sp. Scap27 TaxID=2589986 RepID=UPI0015C13BB9|nr:ribonuclease P protein component [Francisella sp. Scap27]QLE79086.1 ribonuclease P protein component [Francisella sp. Scap27]
MQRNFCLTKQNILSKEEITKVFDNVENKISSNHFTFLIGERVGKEAGFCAILAKKNIRKAVKRNLCRRLLKEAFRVNKSFLDHKGLVILSKKPADKASKEELWQSIQEFQQFLQK